MARKLSSILIKIYMKYTNWLKKKVCLEDEISKHYDILINEGNDPVHDPEPLKA